MSHSQQFRNRRCSCQSGFGVRIGLGNSFLFTGPLFSFCCLLDDACVCSCSSQVSFRSLWMRLRSSRFSSTLADLLFDRLYLPVCGSCGRRRRLFVTRLCFRVLCCQPLGRLVCRSVLSKGFFLQLCLLSPRQRRWRGWPRSTLPLRRVVGTWCFRGSALPCARGDTTGGRIGLALFTQILKGCGSTC